MTHLWLIRHGQASFGSSEYDRLSAIGIRQSGLIGRFLTHTGMRFHSVYTGEMKRQTDTAEIALSTASPSFSSPEPIRLKAFNEYDYMPIITAYLPALLDETPGLSDRLDTLFKDTNAFQKVFGTVMARWISGNHDVPGIESFRDYKERVENGIARVSLKTGSTSHPVVIVTSGGVISVAMLMALGLSAHDAMTLGWEIKNASISVFKYKKNRLNLVSFNATAHLERENAPELLTYR